jgi:hypothetical protein
VLLLFSLGLGGTTPLPRLLFGANWAWLTYDRFSLWAGLALLPLAGLLWELYRQQFHREGAKSASEKSLQARVLAGGPTARTRLESNFQTVSNSQSSRHRPGYGAGA